MKKLGIVGGLGPMATAYFLQLITQMTDAESDQEHIESIIISKPGIPDRTKYILGISDDNPVGEILTAGRTLKDMGADIIAIPCITAHYFHEELEKEIGLPIIHAIRETAIYLEERGIKRIGLLATDGTVYCQLFQKILASHDIQSLIPDEENQKLVMSIIYDNIKAGKEVDHVAFKKVSDDLFEQGAQVILLACTELSLIKKEQILAPGYLDVMEILAKKAVESCGKLRSEYKELITG